MVYLPVVTLSEIFYLALHFKLFGCRGARDSFHLAPFKHTKFKCWDVDDSLLTPNVTPLTPLIPNIKIKILICCPYESSGERLLKYQ